MKNKFWKNKFIIFVCAVIIASFVLCSCKGNENGRKGSPSSTPVPVYSLIPTDVITAGNLKSIVTYEPVCENIKTSENEKTVLYRSEPIGLGDPVEVNVFQYGSSVSKEKVKAKYDSDKAARPSSEDVALDNGYEGFIAIPYVGIYHDGYYVSITAGSGGKDEQKQLLATAAQLAVANLKTVFSNNSEAADGSSGNKTSGNKPDKTDKPQATLSVISVDDNDKSGQGMKK